VAIAPPRIAALEHDDAAYGKANAQVLRNPSVINFLDGCALSLPCHAPGEVPVGLMLSASHGHDERLLALGQAVESALGPRPPG
jgi:aspartyl-tRNA(Asn)/glutamyl-tRNA(Gln) amidotransferase subunit A